MNIDLLKKCYEDYKMNKSTFDKMYDYYCGESDAIKKYSAMEYEESHKMNKNFYKKFIKEEVSYSVGSPVNYVSKDNNKKIVEKIDYHLHHWSRNHDAELMKNLLIYGKTFEIYTVDREEGNFNGTIVNPREGYIYQDEHDNILFFMRFFRRKFDSTQYIDIWTKDKIYHYNDEFKEVAKSETHYFGRVPVAITELTEEVEKDTLYVDIKDIQDGYSIISSDGVNEISNTRAAILVGKAFELDEETVENLKKYRFASLPNTKEANLDWLLKNLNPAYQELMLENLKTDMYELSFHVNNQEKMQSNTSGMALRNRLINLEQKTKLNNRSLSNILRDRIKFLFIYLNTLNVNGSYDYRNISIKFNSVIPSDDLMISQMIANLGEKLPLKTALEQLSFIENADAQIKLLAEEQKQLYGEQLEGRSLLGSDLDE